MMLRFNCQPDVDHWKFCLEVLQQATGLRVNPSKTKIIAIGDLTPDQSLLAGQVGEVVDEVEHLGVILCGSSLRGRERTYTRMAEKFHSRVQSFVGLAASTDIFHRRLLVQALISSTLLHVYRVYPPTPDFLKEVFAAQKKALWSYRFGDEIHGRVKVAERRLGAPITSGGLDLVLPQESALASYISAFLAILCHASDRRGCILDRFFEISSKMPEVLWWGSRSMEDSADWAVAVIPHSGMYFDGLVQLVLQSELDPHLFLHTPVFGSNLTRAWPWNKDELAEMLPGVEVVNDLVRRTRFGGSDSVQLALQHLTLQGVMGEHVRSLIDGLNRAGLAVPALPRGSRVAAVHPLFMHVLGFNRKGVLRRALRRQRRSAHSVDPPAYHTRLAGGQDVPRDIEDMKAAYQFLPRARIESRFKSFQFELLNRTLYSITKAKALGHIESNLCRACPFIISDTSHAVTDCKIPTWFLKFFTKFARTHPKLSEYEVQETRFEFSIPSPKKISMDTETQIQHLFIAVKKFALESQHAERFPVWNNYVIYAKILNIAKRIYRVRRFAHCTHDVIASFVEYLLTINNEVLVGF